MYIIVIANNYGDPQIPTIVFSPQYTTHAPTSPQEGKFMLKSQAPFSKMHLHVNMNSCN